MKFLLLVSALWAGVSAFPGFTRSVPNADKVTVPCGSDAPWFGLGHRNPAGGGPLNLFGQDFKTLGYAWSKALCEKDSDGDGLTNGQELGDPECQWEPGQTPFRTTNITNPGFCDDYNATCPSENMLTSIICDEDFVLCDAKKEPGVKTFDLRLQPSVIPTAPNTFMCQMVNISDIGQGRIRLVASNPILDQTEYVDVINVFKCSKDKPLKSGPYQCSGFGAEDQCDQMISSWENEKDGQCYDQPDQPTLDPRDTEALLLTVMWVNINGQDDVTDQSGMRLFYAENQ